MKITLEELGPDITDVLVDLIVDFAVLIDATSQPGEVLTVKSERTQKEIQGEIAAVRADTGKMVPKIKP